MNRSLEDVPNKPMVATATTWLDRYTPDSGRRHIGQPLGSGASRQGALPSTECLGEHVGFVPQPGAGAAATNRRSRLSCGCSPELRSTRIRKNEHDKHR